MKKSLSIQICLCILFTISACAHPVQKQNTVVFYYSRLNPSFYEASGVIAQEFRTDNNMDDLESLIASYLIGPSDPALTLLFPQKTALKSIEHIDNTLHVILSKDCADMSAIDLVVSCSCLGKTLQQKTDAEQIIISAENGFANLDGPFVFTADRIITEDFVQQLG